MTAVFRMAIKDIKLLLRDRLGAFFIIGFPVLMGLFFGLIMGGPSSGGSGRLKLAIVDQDNSEISKKFVASLAANQNVQIESVELEPARDSVRTGQRGGMIVLPSGFGATAGIFWETPPTIQLGMDPSRTAEAAMVQGFVMESMGGLVGERLNNPVQFQPFIDRSIQQIREADDIGPLQRQALLALFGSFDSMLDSMADLQEESKKNADTESGSDEGQVNFQFADIQSIDIMKEIDPSSQQGQLQKMQSKWDISFPQAMLWGVLACVAGFAISIARENTMGTMIRLKAAPVSRFQILAGKALACFMTVMGVIAFLVVLGVFLGLQPASYVKLFVAAFCVAFCFVGIMMTMAVMGKTEQSVNGIGWASNMVMAMIGGAMIPVMFMPSFMQSLSVISPVKWSILAIEGAIWRQLSYLELALPLSILIGIGLVGMLIGTSVLTRQI